MDGLPGIGSGPLDIVVRTAVIYSLVVVGLRLGGKREVGQLGVIDLVALLLLSNAVQNAMVGTDTSLLGGVLAAAVILIAARIFDLLVRRFPRLRETVIGEPRVLITHGHVWQRALREEEVSDEEIQEALREHGLEDVHDVKLAVLEVDGSISMIPMPEAADRFQASEGGDGARRGGRIRRRMNRRARANSSDGADGSDTKNDKDRAPKAKGAKAP